MVTVKQIPALKARTPEAAYEWWLSMTRLGWNIHPDDDPFDIGNSVDGQWVRLFDDAAARRINVIRDQLFQIPGDHCLPALNALKQVTQLEPALEKLRAIQPDKTFSIYTLDESDKEMVEVSGGEIVIAFDHEGTTITDPRISECGRFKVTHKYYGLKPEAFNLLIEANEYDGGPASDIPVEAWPEIAAAISEQMQQPEYTLDFTWNVQCSLKLKIHAPSEAAAREIGKEVAREFQERRRSTQLGDWDIHADEKNIEFLTLHQSN